jgi:hypothetical protein
MRLASPPFPSLRVLLGYAVITWLRKDDVTSVMSCATIHNAAFSACQIPALIGETEGSAATVWVWLVELLVVSRPVMYEWNRGVLEKQQQLGMSLVHVSSQWVIGVIWEECFCEEKSYMEYLKCKTYSCASRSVAGRQQVERENPSTCATVDCKVCKWETALYCLCISVIYEWVRNHLIINPIIRTRSCLISGVNVTIVSLRHAKMSPVCASWWNMLQGIEPLLCHLQYLA